MLERLKKEFDLELRDVKGRKYIKVTNKETKKVGFIYDNQNIVLFLGHDNYEETTGTELISQLINRKVNGDKYGKVIK